MFRVCVTDEEVSQGLDLMDYNRTRTSDFGPNFLAVFSFVQDSFLHRLKAPRARDEEV